MFDPWLVVYPALMAAMDARRKAEEAAWDIHLHQEQMRAHMRAGSIDVEARWIKDVPLLEAMQ